MLNYSLSGIEYRILKLAHRPQGYSLTMDGPWWMKFLYDAGILQIYINRLMNAGLLREVRTGWHYVGNHASLWVLMRDMINNEKVTR